MAALMLPLALISLLSVGAMFGFFYAWVCSTMWGLDATDPKVAIAAMQAMNTSVRNAVFLPAFFLTPVLLAACAIFAHLQRHKPAALLFAIAAVVYLGGVFMVTVAYNVPMNEALALVDIPQDTDAARQIWQTYSDPWKFWNATRAVFNGLALLLAGLAIHTLNSRGR